MEDFKTALACMFLFPAELGFYHRLCLAYTALPTQQTILFQLSKSLLLCTTCNFFFFFLHNREHLHLLFRSTKHNLQAVLLSDKDPLVSPVS